MELTDYAVAGRYPDDWREIPIDEASEAVKNATGAMSFIREKIGMKQM